MAAAIEFRKKLYLLETVTVGNSSSSHLTAYCNIVNCAGQPEMHPKQPDKNIVGNGCAHVTCEVSV